MAFHKRFSTHLSAGSIEIFSILHDEQRYSSCARFLYNYKNHINGMQRMLYNIISILYLNYDENTSIYHTFLNTLFRSFLHYHEKTLVVVYVFAFRFSYTPFPLWILLACQCRASRQNRVSAAAPVYPLCRSCRRRNQPLA